jgi:hypothetical protein
MSDRLDKQVVETTVIGPFGASGVDIEQQFGLSAGNDGEQDAFAQCGVVAVDHAQEVDAPLVVGPAPVRTPCMTQPSATTASSGVATGERSIAAMSAWTSLVGSTVVDNRCDIAMHTDLLTLGRVVRGYRVQTRKGQALAQSASRYHIVSSGGRRRSALRVFWRE